MTARFRQRQQGLVLGTALARIEALERRAVAAEGRERELTKRVDSLAASLHLLWRKYDAAQARADRRPLVVGTATAKAEEPRRVPAVEAARRLGVAPVTIRRLVEAGDLEGLAIPMPDSDRRVWVVALDSLERFERKAGAVGAVGAPSSAVSGLRRQ